MNLNRKRKALLMGFLLKAAVGLNFTSPPTGDTLFPAFTPNLGQSDPRVLYLSAAKDSNYFLTTSGAVRSWRTEAGARSEVRMRLVKPNFLTEITQEELAPGNVTYAEVYEGIDLTYRSRPDDLEMEFKVRRGDPSHIRLEFEGPDLCVNEAGELTAGTGGALKLPPPAVYLRTIFGMKKLAGRFVPLKGNKVLFQVGPA